MKRYVKKLSLFMALVMLLALCACKKANKEDTQSEIASDIPTAVFDADENAEEYENDLTYDEEYEENEDEILSSKAPDKEDKPHKHPNNNADKPNKNKKPKPSPTEVETLEEKPGREVVKVTIPEGYTMVQIFKKLEASGVCSFDALMKTAQSYDYSYYPLIAARPNRTMAFKLEGYLFPSTYEFYKNDKPQDAIGRFLRKGNIIFDATDKAKAQALGCSLHDILTVASIVEKEGANPNEVRKIAGVIYNRLEKGMKLQMDSGIYYIERSVKPFITGDINRYNSLYNMYKCPALPAGPICNPGLKTINAALDPDTKGDYIYFCHDKNANYYYAATYEEHQQNLEKAGLK